MGLISKLGFEKQDNGVIFATSLLARLLADVLVRFGYLIKLFKYCYIVRKKHLI
jgi:hypothetical protein